MKSDISSTNVASLIKELLNFQDDGPLLISSSAPILR